jgi:hypothetical protein
MSEEFDEPKVTGSPDEIYLVYGDIEEDCSHEECFDVLWCEDQQFKADVRYVRADSVQAKLDAQAAELTVLRSFCNGLLVTTSIDIPTRIKVLMQVHRLVDKDFNPLPVLTGEEAGDENPG